MRNRLDSVVTLPTDDRVVGDPRCCCSAIEDRVSLVGIDARARVAHRHSQRTVRPAAHDHIDLTLVGELQRVPEQVDEDLSDPLPVEHHLGRGAGVVPAEADTLLRGERPVLGHHRLRRARAGRTAAGRAVSLPASILDRSRISLISAEQVTAAALDPAERPVCSGLSGPSTPAEERVGEAEDRVHRRTQLVAHAGQEPRLRLARAVSEAFVSPKPLGQRPLALEQLRQPLAGAVEVVARACRTHRGSAPPRAGRSRPGDPGKRPLHLPDRQDERPRQDEAEQQRHRRRSPPRTR